MSGEGDGEGSGVGMGDGIGVGLGEGSGTAVAGAWAALLEPPTTSRGATINLYIPQVPGVPSASIAMRK